MSDSAALVTLALAVAGIVWAILMAVWLHEIARHVRNISQVLDDDISESLVAAREPKPSDAAASAAAPR